MGLLVDRVFVHTGRGLSHIARIGERKEGGHGSVSSRQRALGPRFGIVDGLRFFFLSRIVLEVRRGRSGWVLLD